MRNKQDNHNGSGIENRIMRCIRKQPMTIEEVSKELEISRATASKYLLVLETRRVVRLRMVGKAKLFFLK